MIYLIYSSGVIYIGITVPNPFYHFFEFRIITHDYVLCGPCYILKFTMIPKSDDGECLHISIVTPDGTYMTVILPYWVIKPVFLTFLKPSQFFPA